MERCYCGAYEPGIALELGNRRKQNLFTFTNAQEVELFVNGKSQGVQKNDTTPILPKETWCTGKMYLTAMAETLLR